jgi:dihydrolipoamide dehydrogenase
MNAGTGCTLICWDKESGTLLGAGAVGVGASEMADLFTVAIELGSTLQDLADMSPAHPTRSELLLEAARQALA